VSTPQVSLLGGAGGGAETTRNAVNRCQEESGLRAPEDATVRPPAVIAGIGTTAAHALQGRLLSDALAKDHIEIGQAIPFGEPDALIANTEWELALVLSPWKKAVAERMDSLTASATGTGVVDTIVRIRGQLVGVNTNCWAAQAAMETVMGGRSPDSVLILGSGGSSNSVALAARRAWPHARLAGSARNSAALAEWAFRFGADGVAPADLLVKFRAMPPSLVINTTTWGETDGSEAAEFTFPFDGLVAPGNSFFDLNNRTSSLQIAALRAGMNVMAGTFMQRVTNACRAALLKAATS
jgi:shikimate dehydrogenase